MATNFQATAVTELFAPWCQENFFRYVREHYHLDRPVKYGTKPIPDGPFHQSIKVTAYRAGTSLARRGRLLMTKPSIPAARLGLISKIREPRKGTVISLRK